MVRTIESQSSNHRVMLRYMDIFFAPKFEPPKWRSEWVELMGPGDDGELLGLQPD